MNASDNYRELLPNEVAQAAAECENAWQDPLIPLRQFEVVAPELKLFRAGARVEPFNALIECLRHLPVDFIASRPRLLDIGSSAGYYDEILRLAGFPFRYTGVDYSKKFQTLAEDLYGPELDIDIGDARHLEYRDGYFEIAISGGTLMHIREYDQVISEAARVASKYVCFHRTPVMERRPTKFYCKEAYGVPCLEVHFNETELLSLFAANGLQVIYKQNVFWYPEEDFGHRNYLLAKPA